MLSLGGPLKDKVLFSFTPEARDVPSLSTWLYKGCANAHLYTTRTSGDAFENTGLFVSKDSKLYLKKDTSVLQVYYCLWNWFQDGLLNVCKTDVEIPVIIFVWSGLEILQPVYNYYNTK